MALEQSAVEKTHTNQALRAFIEISLVVVMAAASLMILRPFLPLIAWGIIIAIASYPGYGKLLRIFGGRRVLVAVIWTLLLLSILIVPVVLLAQTLVAGIPSLAGHLRDGTLTVPLPPARIETWPLIGGPLKTLWTAASTNLGEVLKRFTPQIKSSIPVLLSVSAGIGLSVLQFVLSILVSGVLLASADGAAKVSRSLVNRLFENNGPEVEDLVGSTIRSVTSGILGVAVIQSAFAGLGFLVVGLPGAGLWAMIFLFAAVLQVGPLVLIPAVAYVFTIASTTKAVTFLVWCIIVALMDNILKPLLLGRGAAVPIVVVFLGAIGGFMAMGIIGLFVGAVVLSVGYKLLLAWLEGPTAAQPGI